MRQKNKERNAGAQQESPAPVSYLAGDWTMDFRDLTFPGLLGKEEDEIAEYVVQNYEMPPVQGAAVPRLAVASQEVTARENLLLLMEDLDEDHLSDSPFRFSDSLEHSGDPETEGRERDIRRELAETAGPSYDWGLLAKLRKRFPGDERFGILLDRLDEKLHEDTGLMNQAACDRALMLLSILNRAAAEAEAGQDPADQSASLSSSAIADRMRRGDIMVEDQQLQEAIRNLQVCGYDIQTEKKAVAHRTKKEADGGKDDSGSRKDDSGSRKARDYSSVYSLARTSYPEDRELETVLTAVRSDYFCPTAESREMLMRLRLKRQTPDRRMTRYNLITAHFQLYMQLFDDTKESKWSGTFPDVLNDYRATIDPILIEARYQPISEKNIFDLFIILSLYFHLTEVGYESSRKSDRQDRG